MSDLTVGQQISRFFLPKSSLLYYFVRCIANMNFSEPKADECSTIELRADKDNERDNDEVRKLIDCLQFTLNQHYLIAELMMSLRKPDTNELNQTLAKIYQLYIDLVSNLSDSRADPSVAAAASKNKVEFDVRKGDWLAKHSKATTSINLFGESSTAPAYAKSSSNCSRSSVGSKSFKSSRSSKTSNSLRSSKSTALSVKRINAQLELEAAQLQADHLKDRIEKQSKLTALKNSMRQSESRRKIELAKQRFDTLSKIEEDFSTSLGIFSPKVSKGVNTSHSCSSLSDSLWR